MKEHVTPKRWAIVVLTFIPVVLLVLVAWLGDLAGDAIVAIMDWVTRVAPNRFTRE